MIGPSVRLVEVEKLLDYWKNVDHSEDINYDIECCIIRSENDRANSILLTDKRYQKYLDNRVKVGKIRMELLYERKDLISRICKKPRGCKRVRNR